MTQFIFILNNGKTIAINESFIFDFEIKNFNYKELENFSLKILHDEEEWKLNELKNNKIKIIEIISYNEQQYFPINSNCTYTFIHDSNNGLQLDYKGGF